jgi:hypothetical protein
MNWELVKDLPDHMIAVYYLDGKTFRPLDGKFRQLVRSTNYQYNDEYEFVRLTTKNVMADVFRKDELIFFVKDNT